MNSALKMILILALAITMAIAIPTIFGRSIGGFFGLLFVDKQLLLLLLFAIFLAIFGPRLLWYAGLLEERRDIIIAAVVLGLLCFALPFWGLSHSLGTVIVRYVNETFYLPNDWSYVTDERKELLLSLDRSMSAGIDATAVTPTLIRNSRIPPFLGRSCHASSQYLCDFTQAAKAYYYGDSNGLTPAIVYMWMLGISLLTAVTAIGLTLYYGSDD